MDGRLAAPAIRGSSCTSSPLPPHPVLGEQIALHGRGSPGTPSWCCPLQLGVPSAGCRARGRAGQGRGAQGVCTEPGGVCSLCSSLVSPTPAPAPSPLLHNCSEPCSAQPLLRSPGAAAPPGQPPCPASACPSTPGGAGAEPCLFCRPGASGTCPGREGRARLAAEVRRRGLGSTGHGSPTARGRGGHHLPAVPNGAGCCWVQPGSRGSGELPVSLPSPAEYPGGHREQ